MLTRTITGARVVCYVNGKKYANVMGFSYQSNTPKKPIYALDSTDPVELAPTTTKISGTLSLYRLDDGGVEANGLTTPYEDLPREKYFTLQLIDRGTDRVLFQAQFCSTTSQSWNFPAKHLATGSLSFEALTWQNEVVPLGPEG